MNSMSNNILIWGSKWYLTENKGPHRTSVWTTCWYTDLFRLLIISPQAQETIWSHTLLHFSLLIVDVICFLSTAFSQPVDGPDNWPSLVPLQLDYTRVSVNRINCSLTPKMWFFVPVVVYHHGICFAEQHKWSFGCGHVVSVWWIRLPTCHLPTSK